MSPDILYISELSLLFVVLSMVAWTIYKLISMDRVAFFYFIIAMILYSINLSSFIIRYFVLPPLEPIENCILEITLVVPIIMGSFSFIKGIEYLAKE